MAQQEIASRQDRDKAWGPILERMVTDTRLTFEEKAAYVALVVSEMDSIDSGETIVDLRRVLDRGLAGLKEKGMIEVRPGGEYRLIKGKPSRTPMGVDAEREAGQPAEPVEPQGTQARPGVA